MNVLIEDPLARGLLPVLASINSCALLGSCLQADPPV